VAVVAIVTTGDVGWVLASRRKAIMTGAAATDDLGMVYSVCRSPDVVVVTVLADVAGLNVGYSLAGGFHAVVAAEAVTDDACVVEVGGPPGIRRMAVITGIATVDMRRVLARCRNAVMAGAAGAEDLCVVDGKYRREHVGVVAVLADVRRGYVRRGLARCFHPVMAVDAIADNIHVIEIRRQPSSRCMTVVAGIATRNVVRVLPRRRESIMTRSAGTGYLRMVDCIRGRERGRIVAVLADVRGRDVSGILAR